MVAINETAQRYIQTLASDKSRLHEHEQNRTTWTNEHQTPCAELKFEDLSPAAIQAGKNKELDNLQHFAVYTWRKISDLPPGTKLLTLRWVLKAKADLCRARLAVRDFATTVRNDVYSPTPTPASIRLLLYNACRHSHCIQVGDVTTAFMHAHNSSKAYALPPSDLARPGWCWQLDKAMNGLRTASKDWAETFASFLVDKLGFVRGVADTSSFTHHERQLMLCVHVDDPIASGPKAQLAWMWKELGKYVLIRVEGEVNFETATKFLGRNYWRIIDGRRRGVAVAPTTEYYQSIADVYGYNLETTKGSVIPMSETSSVVPGRADADVKPLDKHAHHLYRSAIGKIQFIAAERPDVQYTLKVLAHKLHAPTVQDETNLKKLVRYMIHTCNYRLYLLYEPTGKTAPQIHAYVDSDWAGDKATRRSTSSVSLYIDGFLVQSGCVSQGNVAQSSAEAEYYALASAAADVLYFETLTQDSLNMKAESTVYNDASAARATAQRQGLSRRLRHIELKYLFVQHLVAEKRFKLGVVSGLTNPANMATKLHGESEQVYHCRQHCLCADVKDAIGEKSAFLPHPKRAQTAMSTS